MLTNGNNYRNVLNYYELNFINNIKKLKNKEIKFWSVQNRVKNNIPIKTNSCEAYHRHLNTKIKKKEQPLGKIIDILKKEEQRVRYLINDIKSSHKYKNRKNGLLKNIVENYKFYDELEFFKELEKVIDIYI